MDSEFKWVGLFRDGHSISGDNLDSLFKLGDLERYISGTAEKPKKHYLLWFKLYVDGVEYAVLFDTDGDAYINLPTNRVIMTEFKIRSSRLIFRVDVDRIELGFVGINTCGEKDGKVIALTSAKTDVMGDVLAYFSDKIMV